MEITWISHACFKIKTNKGKIIYFDPYKVPNDEEKADIIISSHSHGDHFSKSDIKKLMKDSTLILGPESISNNLKRVNGKSLKIGEVLKTDGVKLKLVPAYTIKKQTHPKSNEWAGTILEAEGKKIYHAGDTERIPEMKELEKENITVALLPCGGRFTMDFEESCAAAVDIRPEIVVPMHNWDKSLEEYEKSMKNKDPNIRVEILKNKSLTL
ncbi:MAG: MBL fold metallo-hydrolase [Candidatus Lokiarchaeota archaeon]|nr:MBL fold metallo-hydrolase [Candidatus Lokiarchaeota archaeon]MBD3339953.1 MBL fold metallo-hydrolase [Candidatus Lokiarchaeota archaeon]